MIYESKWNFEIKIKIDVCLRSFKVTQDEKIWTSSEPISIRTKKF